LSKWRKGIILLIAAFLLFNSILPVFANQITDRQEELGSVRADINQRRKELQQNRAEQDRVLSEIRQLESEVRVTQQEISLLAERIGTTENRIVETETNLAEAETQIAEMEGLLATRLRAIHENGSISYLEVLFSSASFAEFLSRFNDLQLIIAEDRVLLTEFQSERERIAGIKIALEQKRQELQVMREQNIAEISNLEKKQTEQQQLQAALDAEHEEMERVVRQMEREASQIERIIRQMQAAQRRSRQTRTAYRGSGQMAWPVPEFGPAWITSRFGFRVNPFSGAPGAWHGGVDIGIPHSRFPRNRNGEPVHAVAADAGVAHIFPMRGGYGNMVIVDHGDGIATLYAHLDSILVGNQVSVSRGQAIGVVGTTGLSTGPHLHFEVHVNGSRVEPLAFIR